MVLLLLLRFQRIKNQSIIASALTKQRIYSRLSLVSWWHFQGCSSFSEGGSHPKVQKKFTPALRSTDKAGAAGFLLALSC